MRKIRWGFWRESFLNELPAIDPSEFIEPVTPILPNFLAVGEMNGFERAAHTWLVINEKKLNELEAQLKEISSARYPEIEQQHEIDSETVAVFTAFSVLQAKVEIIKKALTISIQERLKLPIQVRLALTKGFQICVPREDFDKKLVLASIRVSIVQGEAELPGEEVPPPDQRH